MQTAMTVEEFREALPAKKKKSVNRLIMLKINNILTDPEEASIFRDNLLTYTQILSAGKYRIGDYVNAVRYVGFKMMGYTQKDSYFKTFPDKIKRFRLQKVTDKTISSYIYAYNNTQLVNQIYEMASVPIYLVNAPALQKAINTQVEIMTDPEISPMARTAAANSIMNHIKPPEKKEVAPIEEEAGMSMHEQSLQVIGNMVEAQRELIKQGGNILEIVNAPIRVEDKSDVIDGEVIEEC